VEKKLEDDPDQFVLGSTTRDPNYDEDKVLKTKS